MSDDEPPIDSEAELRTALRSVLNRAATGGLTVEGGWECRNGAEHPDWDIIVTKVEKGQASD